MLLGHSVHVALRKFGGWIGMWNMSFCDALFQHQVVSDLQVRSTVMLNLFLYWRKAAQVGTDEHCT